MAHYIIQAHEMLIHTAHMNIFENLQEKDKKQTVPGCTIEVNRKYPFGIPFVQMCNLVRFFATFFLLNIFNSQLLIYCAKKSEDFVCSAYEICILSLNFFLLKSSSNQLHKPISRLCMLSRLAMQLSFKDFDHFEHGGPVQTGRLYSTGDSLPIKAGHRELIPHLQSTC